MTYSVKLSPPAAKAYQKLDPAFKSRVHAALETLHNHPLDGPQITRLKGRLRAYFRYRVGDSRILYTVSPSDRLVHVDYLQHRKDVYRRFG